MNTAIPSLKRSTPLVSTLYRCGNARSSHTIPLTNWQQIRLRSSSDSLPKFVSPSIWSSIVPKFLRNRGPAKTGLATKEWNPASFFIIIFVLIGSQAIQLLTVRKDYENFTRRADAKLALLKEVLQRLKNGEQVDVEKLLGTGDETKEREWEEGTTAILVRQSANALCKLLTDCACLLYSSSS